MHARRHKNNEATLAGLLAMVPVLGTGLGLAEWSLMVQSEDALDNYGVN